MYRDLSARQSHNYQNQLLKELNQKGAKIHTKNYLNASGPVKIVVCNNNINDFLLSLNPKKDKTIHSARHKSEHKEILLPGEEMLKNKTITINSLGNEYGHLGEINLSDMSRQETPDFPLKPGAAIK